jgi:hypothetical protein
MGHLEHIRPGGVYAPEMVLGASDAQRFDVNQSKLLSGDLGGTYTPSKPIVIGGAGFSGTGVTGFNGGVATALGGRIYGFTDFPQCNARSRTLFVPIIECACRADLATQAGGGLREDAFIQAAISGATPYGLSFTPNTQNVYIEIPRRYTHHQARVASIAVHFVIAVQPAAVPGTLPGIFAYATSDVGVQTAFTPSPLVVPWAAGTTYAVGAYADPAVAVHVNGFYAKATAITTGVSGSTEPVWPSTIGVTVVDAGVTWTTTGRDGRYPYLSPTGIVVTPSSYYSGGAGQTLELDLDGFVNNTIDTTSNRYTVLVSPDPTMILTGLTLSFDSITSLKPE